MSKMASGWVNGLIGVAIFSGSLPATRAAVADFDPVFLTAARALIAGLLASAMLVLFQERRPQRQDIGTLTVVAFGVVVGFPLLSALALRYVTSAHSLVFTGMLPLATAGFAVLRGERRPRAPFWIFSSMGSLLIAGFALRQGFHGVGAGDLLMFAAIVVCGLGYAEGAKLSSRLGGWQVIAWALVIALPVIVPIALIRMPASWGQIGIAAWTGLFYVSVFSMFVGFIFWYRGLSQGGIAAVAQLQLLQPFLGLTIAALLLGEAVTGAMITTALLVMVCVALAKRYA